MGISAGHPGPDLAPDRNGHDEIDRTSSPAFDRHNPFPARLITNRKLSGEGSGKETRHFELSLGNSGLTYEAGDALGVCPTNCPALVEDLAARAAKRWPGNGRDSGRRRARGS